MDKNINKEKLIALINSLNYDSPVVDEIKTFINSYDGTNVDDLNMLVFAVVTFIMGVQEMEVRAEGYDAMEYENTVFEEQMNALKKKYEKLNNGELPEEPFSGHAAKKEENTVQE